MSPTIQSSGDVGLLDLVKVGVVMHFNVSQLIRETSGSTRQHEVEDHIEFRGSWIAVQGGIRLVRTDKGVWVTAPLRTQVESECGRCLDMYIQLVELTIDEEAIPRVDPISGLRFLHDPDPEESLIIDEDNILSLTETVRQYIAISLPMRPLCRSDCAGLCVDCGVNRNHEPCTCSHVQRDSRWGPLLEGLSPIETSPTKTINLS